MSGEVKANLIAAKARFMGLQGRDMQASLTAALQGKPHALDALVALREALPDGFGDFKQFEKSPSWGRNAALQVFDRAIAAQAETP